MVLRLLAEEIMRMASNFNGIILKKAEIEGNFTDYYLKLVEFMITENFSSQEDFLFIFGEMGG
jgi:hypothetical protein